MTRTEIIAIFNKARAANARALDHERKALWIDAQRNSADGHYFSFKAQETRDWANSLHQEWMAAAAALSADDLIFVLKEAA